MNSLERSLILKTGQETGWENVLEDHEQRICLVSSRHPAHLCLRFVADHLELIFTGDLLRTELRRWFSTLAREGGKAFWIPYTTFKLSDSLPLLSQVLRRAAELARSLPDQAATEYEQAVREELSSEYVNATEVERLVRQRVGQDIFRDALMRYWGGACAVTGITVPEVLRASHCKPWAECDSDSERLDVFNGLLLCANLDALFDRGLITFDDAGVIVLSPRLTASDREALVLSPSNRLRWVTPQHLPHLDYHRRQVFNDRLGSESFSARPMSSGIGD